jgi:carboxyl-terminal processing protease
MSVLTGLSRLSRRSGENAPALKLQGGVTSLTLSGMNSHSIRIKQSSLAALLLVLAAHAQPAATFADADERVADLSWLITQIETRYAYLPERHLDLSKIRALYEPAARAARTRDDMIHVVERVVAELHDDHVTLGTNTPSSPQLIPTGAELWAEMRSGRAVIVEVLPGSAAEKAGLEPGDVVVSIGGVPVDQAIEHHGAKALDAPDPEAVNFTLRSLLAGTHDAARRIAVKNASGRIRVIDLRPFVSPDNPQLVTWRRLDDRTGYIRIENSLGDPGTVAAFDAALNALAGAPRLVFDLRNTPSGGNTDIAEPIMGRFISKAAAYQRVFEPAAGKRFPEDSWLKVVEPRGPQVTAKLVILVNHWTGSMGEGMAIGFDAMKRAQIVGTPMARLCGGTERFELPKTAIPVHLPTYRLYHVNGTAREAFVPSIEVDLPRTGPGGDAILARAVQALD